VGFKIGMDNVERREILSKLHSLDHPDCSQLLCQLCYLNSIEDMTIKTLFSEVPDLKLSSN
jgi:hypothetical protein